MKGETRKKRTHVVLAADASGYSIATVSLAVNVARSTKSRLRGVFIEDEDLLRMAGLPFAREISPTTAAARPLENERLQRALRAVSRQFRQSLESEARDLKAGWSFATVRGRMREVGLQARGQAACIIFAQTRAHPWQALSRAPRRILLVPGRSKHLARALDGLLRSLADSRLELTLIADTAEDELALAVPRLAADYPGVTTLRRATRASLPGLLRERGSGYDYALVAQREDTAELTQILERLRCPVLLIA